MRRKNKLKNFSLAYLVFSFYFYDSSAMNSSNINFNDKGKITQSQFKFMAQEFLNLDAKESGPTFY